MAKKNFQISDATRRNWVKLKADRGTKLVSRANKSLSQKQVMADGYVTAASLPRFVEELRQHDYPIKELIFTLCAMKVESNKVNEKNKKRFFEEYSNYERIEIEVPRQILKNRNDDWIGFVYQSIMPEGTRVATGLYYTNPSVVRTMLSQLDLTGLKSIFDPCCGSGIFLLLAEGVQPEQLYGVDNDPLAVMIAKANLMVKYNESDLYPQIFQLDFLLQAQTAFGDHKFDIIVTNPPWGNDRANDNRERASEFFQKSLNFLDERGFMNFLLPTALLKIKSHEDFRQYVMNHSCVENIHLFDEHFNGVYTDFVSLVVSVMRLDKKHRMDCSLPILTQNEKEILALMDRRRHDDLSHSQWALGIITGNNEKMLKDKLGKGMEKIYRGKDIEKYTLKEAVQFIKYDRTKFQQCAKDEFYRADEKLVYKFIANHLCFAYDNTRSLFLNSANILIPNIEGMSTKTVMAFLNSTLFSFYYNKRFGDIKILKSNLCSLPFPEITAEQDRELSAMVDEVLSGRREYIQAIDDYVCALYDVKPYEIKY